MVTGFLKNIMVVGVGPTGNRRVRSEIQREKAREGGNEM